MPHTPGPLSAVQTEGEMMLQGNLSVIHNAEGREIAVMIDGTWDDAVRFTAAPDLLAACEAVRLWLDGAVHFGQCAPDEPVIAQVQAAIAKAKGQEEG